MWKWARLLLFVSVTVQAATPDTDWAVLGNSADMQHYSPLGQINQQTVQRLGLAWSTDLPTSDGLVGNPLVSKGVIFQSGARGFVVANDLRTGKTLWTYNAPHQFDGMSITGYWGSLFNRGVALFQNLVIVASDCRLIALDQATGKTQWQAESCDSHQMYTITAAPRVGGGLVFTGNNCMDSGASRGYVDAFDGATGKHVWRFYTVPGDPAGPQSDSERKLSDTWGTNWYAKTHGCGSVWDAITYDSVLNRVYIGVDGPSPFSPAERAPDAGDELYSNSVVALDAATGKYLWHFKVVPHDGWNFTPTGLMVADLPLDGHNQRVVITVPKNGFEYLLDAKTGRFLRGHAYMAQNWAAGLDAKGLPIVKPEAQYWTRPDKSAVVYPGGIGGHGWEAMALDPRDHLLYIPSQVSPMSYSYDPTALVGGLVADYYVGPAYGDLVAWDTIQQKERWRKRYDMPVNGGLLSTASNLLFQGTADGQFIAYDSKSGVVLWSHDVGGSIRAAPSTVMSGGRQYILIAAGNGSSAATGSYLSKYTTTHRSRSQPRLLAFALDGSAPYPAPATVEPIPPPAHARYEAPRVAAGRRLFEGQGCLDCHGVFGDSVGGTVPNLIRAAPSLELLKAVIQQGVLASQGMPRFREMSDADVVALYAYIIDCGWNAYEEDRRARRPLKSSRCLVGSAKLSYNNAGRYSGVS